MDAPSAEAPAFAGMTGICKGLASLYWMLRVIFRCMSVFESGEFSLG